VNGLEKRDSTKRKTKTVFLSEKPNRNLKEENAPTMSHAAYAAAKPHIR
jgi:hypothetical protein